MQVRTYVTHKDGGSPQQPLNATAQGSAGAHEHRCKVIDISKGKHVEDDGSAEEDRMSKC